ncbi:hypothetical protein [Streptomyces incanus]|uniref:Uncharacterized protein n=1 Tax=Streptomyces incanus TaxID=887453 RepID=A0ABW0XI08_9ACTN
MQRQTKRPSAATIRALGEILTGGDFYGGEAVRAFAWPLVLTGPGPAPAVGAQSPVRVLPNFDVVALDGPAPAEALLLDACATRPAEHVWTLSTASLLKALHAGRGLEDLRRFLTGGGAARERNCRRPSRFCRPTPPPAPKRCGIWARATCWSAWTRHRP